MSTLTPSIARLKSLLALEEKHAALLLQAEELQQEISGIRQQLFDGLTTTSVKTAGRAVRKTKAPRGALKEKIIAALESAGSAGVRVTELASTLGTKAANLHAWFHSTAKNIPEITKIGGGHYRLHPKGPKPVATKVSKEKPVKAKADGAKRGGLSEKILGYLGEAGSEGVTIKDIADKADTNYRNVAVWFATTGKKFPKIKKVRPATYRLAA
jgi:hypothetical protein